MSFSFFSGLRVVLAKGARVELGPIVVDVIKDLYIPQLEEMLDAATSIEAKQEIEELIGEYELWSRRGSRKAEIFNKVAAKAVRDVVKSVGRGEYEVEEVGQRLALEILTSQGIRNSFERFRVLDGPQKLASYWFKIVKYRAMNKMRYYNQQKNILEKAVDPLGEGDDELESLDRIESPEIGDESSARVDDDMFRALKRQLEVYVRKNMKNDQLSMDVFDLWISLASKKGPDRINFKRDVSDPLIKMHEESGVKGVNKSSIHERWKAIQKVMLKYFERELGLRLTDAQKKKLKISSMEQALIIENFRRRLAAYMLEPLICRQKYIASLRRR